MSSGQGGGARLGALATVAFLVAGAFHGLLYPRIADADGFYHVGHARAYAQGSLFDTSFPWTAFSVVAEAGADLWWGFHALLVPLAPVGEVEVAIRLSALLLTLAALAAFAWLARRHRFLGEALWPALFLVAVPNVLYRYLAVRPEVLSLPLALLLLSALTRRERGWALAFATAITWIHLSMFWLGPGIAVLWAGSAWLLGRTMAPKADAGAGPSLRELAPLVGLVLVGTAAGWLLRPHPVAAAELAWIQIAELLLEKTGSTPLTFAVDLAPLSMGELWRTAWPLLAAWIGGLAYLGVTAADEPKTIRAVPRQDRELLAASTLLAAGFLFLTVAVARRSLVHWAAFAIPGVALVLTHLTPPPRRRAAGRGLLAAFTLLFGWSLWRNQLNVRFVAHPPDYLAEVADFLERSSEPGEVVFTTHWDTFGPLFARNRTNHYPGGMDPIFQYAYDRERYWAFHHLSTDVATAVTCPFPDCEPDQVLDTWTVVREDFGARWILVEPRRNPRLSLFLLDDPRFRLALETPSEAVFEALPPGEAPPAR